MDVEKHAFDYEGYYQPVVVEEVITGNMIGAGQGQNVARQAAIRAGIPKETPAYSVNKVCGSGMKAVALAAQTILIGEDEVFLCGGMENMSRLPAVFKKTALSPPATPPESTMARQPCC